MFRDRRVDVAVFTRDLRTRDNPVLAAAAQADDVVPLFVLDEALAGLDAPNRRAFLAESLVDLHESLTALGAGLAVRSGPFVDSVARVAAEVGAARIHIARDVSALAQRRLAALQQASRIPVVVHDSHQVLAPGAVSPLGGGPFKVFTPYYRRWLEQPWRPVIAPPQRLSVPDGLVTGCDGLAPAGGGSPHRLSGGETAALSRLATWTRDRLITYDHDRDDLASGSTSQISASLHFGCLSALEVASVLRSRPGAEPYVRQVCWRDFYAQILAARPEVARDDYRDRGDNWNDERDWLEAWCDGRTGVPVVDAAMRQLQVDGFMHNRARMIVASYLTKDLYIDWRRGAEHFERWLVDADVASNRLNWQWVAGTGSDTNPNRIFNPAVQAARFDPRGEYIVRYLPQLAGLDPADLHRGGTMALAARDYPMPLVDHHEAIAEYRARLRR
jgi:deoxyribodipyrimidine photo-lyase